MSPIRRSRIMPTSKAVAPANTSSPRKSRLLWIAAIASWIKKTASPLDPALRATSPVWSALCPRRHARPLAPRFYLFASLLLRVFLLCFNENHWAEDAAANSSINNRELGENLRNKSFLLLSVKQEETGLTNGKLSRNQCLAVAVGLSVASFCCNCARNSFARCPAALSGSSFRNSSISCSSAS